MEALVLERYYGYEIFAESMKEDPSLIIQEFMNCTDLDADVYIDTISHEAVAEISKKKIEPRIGGTYLRAYGAGVDFIKLIEKNLNWEANVPEFENYEEGVVMMIYDSVVIRKPRELAE